MILITFLLLFLFTKPVLAVSPTITINEPLPSNIIVGEEFSVTFTVNTVNIGTTYHYKIVGDDNTDLSTLLNTSCASNYENCENLTITSDKIATATAKARLNTSTGVDNIKIRIAQSDKHSSTSESSFISISSIIPSPTPTLAPTATPNPTSVPTTTSTPTSKPTITKVPTLKITPTSTLSATPTEFPTDYPTPDQILGAQSEEITPTIVIDPPKTASKNLIPGVFIGLGGILLLTPLILAKIKHGKKKIE